MQKRYAAVTAAAIVLGVAGVTPALAHGGHDGHGEHGSAGGQTSAGNAGTFTKPSGGHALTFAAHLSGANEVPVKGGPAVNDPDGKAVALVKVKGDRVTFALQWKGFVPSLGHIHQGAAGQNGDVKVPLFGTAMPDSVHSAAGQVAITDAKLANSIRSNPSGFYVNLHSAEFPGGAVRGQLKPLHKNVNPLDIIKGGKLRALSNGDQEVPKNDASKVGDPDGHAVTFLQPKGTNVDYSLAWINIKSPTNGHIHKGTFGKNGDVVFNFFNRPVPDGIFAVSGKLEGQNADVVKRVRANPRNYYSNIHTAEFPDGAVRGQLFH
ncbi:MULTISPECIES: CHRD domain-containing protein [unclassified Streptomyces]|uniref:CHRD domain-containing protein n=1 Tax=unclassified Streptomyces TaxID=2593676 RepID=UPI002DDC89F0|nr:CHRD domain-containing protein [Streptomyces sp. NBC_01750]WSB02614.1 CHRD domain-containing protein [Streptomyces sp. NBC_01794]WSD33114.1 CHRD domain-containing protein [Streptomyces sp. NBC_01750]